MGILSIFKKKEKEPEEEKEEERKVGNIIVENAVQRKPGFLYYIDGEGNLCEAKMGRGKKSSPEPNVEEK